MKKRCIIAVTMVLVAVLLVSLAFAEDEIRFRSVDWFQTYDAVIDALGNEFDWNNPSTTLGKYVLDEYEQHGDSTERNYPCICTVTSNKKASLRVAGFDVTDTKLFFAYTPNAQGEIDHKIANTSFYMARYAIDSVDSGNTVSVLKEKLSAIYGTARTMENSNDCASGSETYYLWKGGNETKVVLINEDMSYGEPTVYLYYCTDKGTELIKEAEKLQKQAEADALMDAGSDGL